ncbi:MAG: hypothetical protein JO361_04295 [Gammaproteobacteria bacterium]|nr:hypothetical protein [Gammaproteobacteria bacterium]
MNRLPVLIGGLVIGLTALIPADTRAAASEYSGTWELTIVIAGFSSLPSAGETAYCMFVVLDSGDASGNDYKGVGVGSTQVTLQGENLSISIPYTWALSTPASNHVKPSFGCVLLPNSGAAATTAAALALGGLRLTDLPTYTGVPTAQGTTTRFYATTQL